VATVARDPVGVVLNIKHGDHLARGLTKITAAGYQFCSSRDFVKAENVRNVWAVIFLQRRFMRFSRLHWRRFGFVSLAVAVAGLVAVPLWAQVQHAKMLPGDTEVWTPEPPVVTPGPALSEAPPSDAVVLFDGTNLDQWVKAGTQTPASWTVVDGTMKVNKKGGNIETKRKFKDYQLHVEYQIPQDIAGSGQARGNSGVFLASTGGGDAGFELQVLDNYNNKTYVNGMAGSLYKQSIPLANPCRKPGEWQYYDVAWTAPRFKTDGTVETPAYATVFFNGVLVDNHFELKGETLYIGEPKYHKAFDAAPIKLQAHGDGSAPISFRNIWVRELTPAQNN
jgi:hypothetical protein